MKIFVAGGAGFIGSSFIRHVLALGKNYAAVNYDKLTYAGNLANLFSVATNPNYRFAKGDICDAAAVEAAMRGSDVVVHFAAESHVDRSIYEPAPAIESEGDGAGWTKVFPLISSGSARRWTRDGIVAGPVRRNDSPRLRGLDFLAAD